MASSAAAQSFHVHEAPVRSDGVEVGSIREVGVTLTFRDTGAVVARVADRELDLELELELGDDDVRISAGVGRRVRLGDTGPWPITMRRGSWAPVAGWSADGVWIALPNRLPVRRAILPRGAAPARRAPTRGREAQRLRWPDGQPLLVRSPTAPRTATPWQVPEPSHVRDVRRVGTGRLVDVTVAGFTVRALLEPQVPCECSLQNDAIPATPPATPGSHRGRAVRLPRGTRLFASPTAARPIATVRRPVIAFEPLESPRVTRCRQDREPECIHEPPLPTGPSRWRVITPHARLLVWVREPAEALPDASDGSSG